MKKLLALALVAVLAGGAVAQDGGVGMGVFFASPYNDANTNLDTTGAPFDAYLVLLGAPFDLLAGYECSIDISDGTVFVLGVTGPNGWTNFGSNTNHLCGYQTAVPVPADGVVMATLNLLYAGSSEVTISLGPATPASIPGVPVVADFANPDDLIGTGLTSGQTVPAVVATLNGGGIVATESHTLTEVKALFD